MLVTIPSWLLWTLGVPVGLFLYIIIGGLLMSLNGWAIDKIGGDPVEKECGEVAAIIWPLGTPVLVVILLVCFSIKGMNKINEKMKSKRIEK